MEADITACKELAAVVLRETTDPAQARKAFAQTSPEHSTVYTDILRYIDAAYKIDTAAESLLSPSERQSFLRQRETEEKQLARLVSSSQVQLHGSTAIVTPPGGSPIHMFRTPDGWRVDIDKFYKINDKPDIKQFFADYADACEDVLKDLQAGKLATNSDLNQVVARRIRGKHMSRGINEAARSGQMLEPFKGSTEEIACKEAYKRVKIALSAGDAAQVRSALTPSKGEINEAVDVILTDMSESSELEALIDPERAARKGSEWDAVRAMSEMSAHKAAEQFQIQVEGNRAGAIPSGRLFWVQVRFLKVKGKWLVNPNDVLPLTVENISDTRRKIAIRRKIVAEIRAGERPANMSAITEFHNRIANDKQQEYTEPE